jgi:hypothetical protein
MVLVNFFILPAIPLSIVSLILFIIGIITKKEMLKRVCGTVVLTTPGLIYLILIGNFLTDVLQVPYQWALGLAFFILMTIVTLLLILLWREKKE